jgi:ferredoxin
MADKKKYKIEYDREGCIGAAMCVSAADDNWVMDEKDGKANVKHVELSEEELERNLKAARDCPVNVIHIIEQETKNKLI